MSEHVVQLETIYPATALAAGATNSGSGYVGNAAEVNVYVTVTGKSGTSPTLDIILQTSPDDSVWFDHTTMSQITANGNVLQKISANVGKYMRANMTVGGSDTPTYTVKVELERKS